jgi:hypothetical protein
MSNSRAAMSPWTRFLTAFQADGADFARRSSARNAPVNNSLAAMSPKTRTRTPDQVFGLGFMWSFLVCGGEKGKARLATLSSSETGDGFGTYCGL